MLFCRKLLRKLVLVITAVDSHHFLKERHLITLSMFYFTKSKFIYGCFSEVTESLKTTIFINKIFLRQPFEVVYVTLGNPAFCLALYLTGVPFRGELQYVGDVSKEKIKYRQIRIREIGGVRLSDELYVFIKFRVSIENFLKPFLMKVRIMIWKSDSSVSVLVCFENFDVHQQGLGLYMSDYLDFCNI